MASPTSDRFENLQLPTSMASRELEIVISQSSRGQRILTLKGPLTMRTLFKFQETVRPESSPVLIVDFSDVPYLDSCGIGAVIAAHVSARKSNRRILFAAFSGQARNLVEMTQLSKALGTYDTIQDAEAAVLA